MISLQNSHLSIRVNPLGAELSSLKSQASGTEFLWQKEQPWWQRQAPILFPFVGKSKNGTYKHKGISYPMGQHGFARDKVFELTEQSETKLVFSLKADSETAKIYPFNFLLKLSYELKQKSLHIGYEVQNLGKETMFFSIGGHPAFRCPLKENEAFEDYSLLFSSKENTPRLLLKDGLFSGETQALLEATQELPLSHQLFELDAIVLRDLHSSKVQLKSSKHGTGLVFDFNTFPYLGIWTQVGAPFICIEPWYGLADFEAHSGELEEKIGIEMLLPQQIFEAEYSVLCIEEG